MSIIKDFKYLILSLREQHLLNLLKNSTKRSYSNKVSKNYIGKGTELIINSQTLKLIEQVKTNVTEIVKKTDAQPEMLLEYVKATETPVYKMQYADKFLNLIHEEEGLIYEKKGIVALYLSLITTRQFKFKTQPMFLLKNGEYEKEYILHHFYRWYSLKSGLPGFEYEVQMKLKKTLFDRTGKLIKKFSLEEILSIKEAVSRDQEASEFVLQYIKFNDEVLNSMEKFKNNDGVE